MAGALTTAYTTSVELPVAEADEPERVVLATLAESTTFHAEEAPRDGADLL
jgi:hypothetical protein